MARSYVSEPPPAQDAKPADTPPPPPRHPKPVTQSINGWTLLGALVVLIALGVVAAFKSPGSDQGVKDATSALILISAAAVGIERILELFWTFVDNTSGSFWPFTVIDSYINSLVNSITAVTSGPLTKLERAVDEANQFGGRLEGQLNQVPAEITAIRADIANLLVLAPTSDRAKAIADYTTKALKALAKRYPDVSADIGIATQSISAVSELVDSLATNPGRRILSLYAGAILGLVVVLALGLDVFHATLGTLVSVTVLGWPFQFGVAATGLLIGLGSNPTHEVIKLLQTIKENQKA